MTDKASDFDVETTTVTCTECGDEIARPSKMVDAVGSDGHLCEPCDDIDREGETDD